MDFNAKYVDIIEKAESGDVFAMYNLARLYDLGALPDPSDSKYIYWYKKFWASPVVDKAIYNFESKDDYVEIDGIDILQEMALRECVIDAGLALGLYYMNSTDKKEAYFAYECLGVAFHASGGSADPIPQPDGNTTILELISKQAEWLKELGVDCYDC